MNIENKIYYIAGLLEGEGSFGFYGCPVIQINMTDGDVIEGARKILHPKANIRTQQKNDRKLMYILHISGPIAIQWMMTIYPLMKMRRKQKIREVIEKWKEVKNASVAQTRNPEEVVIHLMMKKGLTREQAIEKVKIISTIQ